MEIRNFFSSVEKYFTSERSDILNAAFVLNHQATPPLPTEACVFRVGTNFTQKKASQNWLNLKTPAKCEYLGG